MPRSLKTSSASGQVGELAASTITWAATALAISRSNTPPRAAGIKNVDRHGQGFARWLWRRRLEADDLVGHALRSLSSSAMSIPSRFTTAP